MSKSCFIMDCMNHSPVNVRRLAFAAAIPSSMSCSHPSTMVDDGSACSNASSKLDKICKIIRTIELSEKFLPNVKTIRTKTSGS